MTLQSNPYGRDHGTRRAVPAFASERRYISQNLHRTSQRDEPRASTTSSHTSPRRQRQARAEYVGVG